MHFISLWLRQVKTLNMPSDSVAINLRNTEQGFGPVFKSDRSKKSFGQKLRVLRLSLYLPLLVERGIIYCCSGSGYTIRVKKAAQV